MIWFKDKEFVKALESCKILNKATLFPNKKDYIFFQFEKKWNEYFIKNVNDIKKVREIIINNKNIKDITWIWNFTNLIKLTIEKWNIQKWFKDFDKLKELKVLNLINCNLQEIPKNIWNLKKLRVLCLKKNNIKTDTDNLYKLKELKVLDLSDNKIQNISYKITKLVNLLTLDLENNNIEKLPDYFNKLDFIILIILDFDKLKNIPKNLLKYKEKIDNYKDFDL